MPETQTGPRYCTTLPGLSGASLKQALRLRDSLRQVRPGADLHLLVAEHPAEVARLRTELPGVPLLGPDEIGCPAWLHMAFLYDPREYGAALKPWLVHTILSRGDVVYLDPDIEVLAPPEELEQALRAADVVLMPEVTRPPDPASMEVVLRQGQFNLSLLGLRQGAAAGELTAFWQRALAEPILDEDTGAPCTDRFWAAAFASLAPSLCVLRPARYRIGAMEAQNEADTAEGPPVLVRRPAQGESPASASFAAYHDGAPIPPSHRAAFRRLHPANRRAILNPFVEQALFQRVVAQSAVAEVPAGDSLAARCLAAEARLNTAPHRLMSYAAAVVERAVPRSRTRDLVYNAIRDAASGARRLYEQIGQVRHA